MKLIFLDTETTSLEDPKMIQLAYKVVEYSEDWKFVEKKTFNKLFKTDTKIDIGAMAIHHITESYLKENWNDLEDFREEIELDLKDSICIAHNSPFDKGVLDNHNIINPDKFWIDTKKVAYMLVENAEKYNLQYLRYYFGVEFEEEINPHDALSDILVLEKVFHNLILEKGECLFKQMILDFVNITLKPLLLRDIVFWQFKWMTFKDLASTNTMEYQKINKNARAGQTWKDYLKWLLWSELKKEEHEKNKDLIYTIDKYL